MISIRESVSDLERADRLRRETLECYIAAIRSVAHYAIELEEKATEAHRRHLEALAGEVEADIPGALVQSRASLRGLLREYRDKASQFIGDLRREMENSVSALQQIMESLAQSDGDHDIRLRGSLTRLREISASPECGAVGSAILSVANAVEQSVEQMRHQHQLTISQFQVEIRMLHQRIDGLERAAMLDAMSKLLNRGEMESRIREAAAENFSLLLMRTKGLSAAERQFGAPVAAEMAGAFGKRLRNSLPPDALIGQWDDEAFIAKVDLPKREAVAAARRVAEGLSGAYSCLRDGRTVRPSLQVSVAVVDRESGEPPTRTLARAREFFA
ncbi:MAG: diguanylate cyclase [Bryobacteraceae bacterium]|jgi:GGDEF domain-containing protein